MTVAAGLICGPVCSSITSAVVTGLASGDLGLALKAGLISMATATAFTAVGDLTGSLGLEGVLDPELGGHGPLAFLKEAHLFNIAGHAAVGCASSVASGGKCGPGALSGAVGSFAGPLLAEVGLQKNLIARATLGGLASVAGGGKFGNGAVTAAFGYLYNDIAVVYGHQIQGSLNLFGHIAIAVEGFGIFSFGNDTTLGSSATDYFERQSSIRDNTVVLISTTKEQDRSILAYLFGFNERNGVGYCDNCASRTANALNKAGLYGGGWAGACPIPAATCAMAQSNKGSTTYQVPRGSSNLPNLNRFNPQ